jgi:hypothetical protein
VVDAIRRTDHIEGLRACREEVGRLAAGGAATLTTLGQRRSASGGSLECSWTRTC